jgi:predicted GNAT superfamily acetyltransferase
VPLADPPLDPGRLGFVGSEEDGWKREIRGRRVRFRVLRTLPDLAHAETLQERVYGISERDLVSATELIVVEETGGAVIGAFLEDDPEQAAGVLVGWGGYIGRPRVVSDFMAVRLEARNLGLAFEMKRLQAAIAASRGFVEIVWTVDPLLAANARLNFGKLGAVSRHYEIDRYGAGFAADRYGGMPSDRLHLVWEIASPLVIARLLGEAPPDPDDVPIYAPGISADRALVPIPSDFDALVQRDPAAAREWRLRVREQLLGAFAAGFVITDFRPARGGELPAHVLQRVLGVAVKS